MCAIARQLPPFPCSQPPCFFSYYRALRPPSKSSQHWVRFLTLTHILYHVSVDIGTTSQRVGCHTRSHPRIDTVVVPNPLRRLVVVLRPSNMGTTLHAMRYIRRKYRRKR